MYSALAVHYYNNKSCHSILRNYLCNNLFKIIFNDRYKGRLSYETCPKEEELKDDHDRFIYKLVCFHREILEGTNDYDVNSQISPQTVFNYINKQKRPSKKWNKFVK